jgi:hypothetical protein
VAPPEWGITIKVIGTATKEQGRLYASALERDLRKSTVIEYERCLRRVGVLLDDAEVTLEGVTEGLWNITIRPPTPGGIPQPLSGARLYPHRHDRARSAA